MSKEERATVTVEEENRFRPLSAEARDEKTSG